MEPNSVENSTGVDKNINIEFLILLFSAFILSYVPILNLPFSWIMTFFHEISHGISAIITGGSVEKIRLHLNGSGLCYTRGGIRFIILQAGYFGAVAWGVLIYKMASGLSHKKISLFALFFIGLVTISALLYAKDIITWIILLVISGLFIIIIKMHEAYSIKFSVKFVGVYVLLDAVQSPLHLIDGRHYGDGAKLADLTGIPEIFWVILWLVTGVISTFFLWKKDNKNRLPGSQE